MLDGSINGENVELMDFSKFSSNVWWGDAIANFPTGIVKSFSKRKNSNASFPQSGKSQDTLVNLGIENQMFIDFIAENEDIGAL